MTLRFRRYVVALGVQGFIACVGSDPGTPTPNADGGAPPAADAGTLPGTDAADLGDGATDSGQPPAPSCDRTRAFADPTVLKFLDNKSPSGGTLTNNELTLVYYIGSELSIARRGARDAPFGASAALTDVNGPQQDWQPFVTGTGGELYFSSDRPAGGEYHLYLAEQGGTSDFTNTKQVSVKDTMGNELTGLLRPWLWRNELRFNVGGDIWVAYGSGTSFDHAVRDEQLSTTATEQSLAITEDGLQAFVSTTWKATGQPDGGPIDFHILTATRTGTDKPFGPLTQVTELAGSGAETVDWITPDGCRIYYGASTALGQPGTLMTASRPKL